MTAPSRSLARELFQIPVSTSSSCIGSKEHCALQTRHLLFIHRVNVRHNSVFACGHLRWDLDVLRELHRALLQRTAQVDVADLVAEVGLLPDERNQAVFDVEQDFGTGLDVFGEGAGGGDGEVGARSGRIGRKVDVVDREDKLGRVGAVLGKTLGWGYDGCFGRGRRGNKMGLLTVKGLSPGTGIRLSSRGA
jgi:hypothetical protein